MQDRFKFRIWNSAEMHYNDFVVTATGYVGKITEEFLGKCVFNQEDLTADKECVLMQCTGLKDKNGKLIYEGDIVRSNEYPFMSEEQDNYYAEICWDDESEVFFYYTFKNPKFNDVCGLSTGNTGNLNEYEWEVVGNIYENPELLKE